MSPESRHCNVYRPETASKAVQPILRLSLFLLILSSSSGWLYLQAQVQVETLPLKQKVRSWGRLGGISVDRLGMIYISNFGESVWKILPDGEVILLSDSLYGSSGNTVDSGGNLLQASFFDNRIYRFRRDHKVELVAGGLDGPVGVTTDSDENIYVCNCRGNSIIKLDSRGAARTLSEGKELGCPNGIAADAAGNLYIASFGHNGIFRIRPSGERELFSQVPGNGNAHLVVSQDTLYVTKYADHQIYAVDLSGRASLIAGTGERGLLDGPGESATFSHPNGLALAPGGKILLTNTIRGAWRTTAPAELVIRRIILPGPSEN